MRRRTSRHELRWSFGLCLLFSTLTALCVMADAHWHTMVLVGLAGCWAVTAGSFALRMTSALYRRRPTQAR
jgi:hypothetical protein